jgi:two-component system OmpR family sensor kinase
MSLRLKLVLLVLGLTTALLGGLGLALAGSLRSWTIEVVDAELSHRADVLTHELKFDDGELELDEDDDLGSHGLPFRVEKEDGTVLLGSDVAWPAASLSGLGFTTTQSRAGEPLRVLSLAFTPHHGRTPLVVRVAAPLTAPSELADRFRDGLLLALLLAAVLSTAGAALLAHWFLAPMRRLAREVDGLEARALDARLGTKDLGPELGRLAQTFNELLGRIAAAVAQQREFIGRASHALRTPLSSILTQAEVALRRERETESYRATLESIAAASRDAAQLADGLLALARADAAAPTAKESVVLTELTAELDRLFRPRAEAKGLRFELSVPPGLVVRATRARLRELLDALLDNALRYTPPGGVVSFEARPDGKALVLEVLDSGPGIAADERAHVFERFFRGSAATTSGEPGSGLGLAVVKALVEAEGATVAIGERAGGGARVSLTFPE